MSENVNYETAFVIVDQPFQKETREILRRLIDGVDYQRINRVMEAFGLPLGPEYLAGVLGIDTLGLQGFADKVEFNAANGPLYALTDGFKTRLKGNHTFY